MGMILGFIDLILGVFLLLLIARAVITWFPNIDPNNQLVRMLYTVTEPVLQPVRNIVPPQNGIDFSPMILMLGIIVIRMFI